MSWMDWGSRPKKNAATPPPLYMTSGGEDVPYCHSCGRVVGSRRSQSAKAAVTSVKYCSDRCKRNKPGPTDLQIEAAFAALLDGKDIGAITAGSTSTLSLDKAEEANISATDFAGPKALKSTTKPQKTKRPVKGDPRLIIQCSEVEALVFAHEPDPEKTFGRRKNRARRGVAEDYEDWKSVDMLDDHYISGSGNQAARENVGRTSGQRNRDRGDTEDDDDDDETDEADFTDSTVESFDSSRATTTTTEPSTTDNGSDGGVSLAPLSLQSRPTTTNPNTLAEKNPKPAPSQPTNDPDNPRHDAERAYHRLPNTKPLIRPAQHTTDINGSIGGEKGRQERIVESEEMLAKRREGQRRAEEREAVRCAARRACVFGLVDRRGVGGDGGGDGARKGKGKGGRGGKGKGGADAVVGAAGGEGADRGGGGGDAAVGGPRRKCEAVMNGAVVEPSFAKGDWGIRWRELV